ncbi:hypothetical protein A4H96_07870 [Acidithiobacillus ferrooxidans]|uniref:Uncharacterized protein n=1 Tax=Acidithiobacillus ferrooxidans TaxID=920 RepID=A0A179BHP0_ACIFR|nr:hypothetical protein A4H96_07870 [Acidithiobacillus ferrooxidans]
MLKQLSKLFRCQTCVTHNTSKCKSIDRVVAWDGKNACTIGHNNVFALANDAETRLLKSANCCEMIDAGNLWQDLVRHFYFAHFFSAKLLVNYLKVFTECVFDAFNGLCFSSTLRPAARQARH